MSNRRSCRFCIQVCSWLQFPAKKSPAIFPHDYFRRCFFGGQDRHPRNGRVLRAGQEAPEKFSSVFFKEVVAELPKMIVSNDGENAAPFPLTATDRELLALDDTKFQPHTWDELKQIIGVATSIRLQARNI